jgi:hypothetical protein
MLNIDLTEFVVTPQCFDATAGTGGDDTDALRAWLDDPRPLKFLPARRAFQTTVPVGGTPVTQPKIGPYNITGSLTHTGGNIAIVGLGNRNSIIRVKPGSDLDDGFPNINNNFADLSAKVNGILTVLQALQPATITT